MRPTSFKKSHKSFTFLEIIITVGLITFILGMVLFNMDSLTPRSRLKAISKESSNFIELAISIAASQGRDISMRFDNQERLMLLEYYFETDEDLEFFEEEYLLEGSEQELEEELEPLITYEWHDSLDLLELNVETYNPDDEQRDFIVFSPLGSSDAATITWREKSGITQEIELWPLLGKITINPIKDEYGF